jgi:hypothetical protein
MGKDKGEELPSLTSSLGTCQFPNHSCHLHLCAEISWLELTDVVSRLHWKGKDMTKILPLIIKYAGSTRNKVSASLR